MTGRTGNHRDLERGFMIKNLFMTATIAVAGLATVSIGVFPTSALAQGYHHHRHHRVYREDDQYYRSNSDLRENRYADRHCGSGDGAVGTIAGGAGGAVLGNVLGGGTLGTVAGGIGGALLGRTLDKQNTRDRNQRRNGC